MLEFGSYVGAAFYPHASLRSSKAGLLELLSSNVSASGQVGIALGGANPTASLDVGGPTLLRGLLTVGRGNVTATMAVDSGGTADAVLAIGPSYASLPARSFQIVSQAGGQSVQMRRGDLPIFAVNADGTVDVSSPSDLLLASYSSAGEIVFNSTIRLLGDMQMGPKPATNDASNPVKSISIAVRLFFS